MLPVNEVTITFESVGEFTKKRFVGDFTFKCVLNNAESMQAAIMADRYNGGSTTLPTEVALYNRATAELELRIKSSPKWWSDSDSGRTLMDRGIVFELFNKAMDAQIQWKEKLTEEAKTVEETNEKVKAKKANKEA